jgi:glycosyltransferase involved in cell wall biosynthesis
MPSTGSQNSPDMNASMAGPAIPVLVGPFPGPVHGVSMINAKLAGRMQAQGQPPACIDLSPGASHRGVAYHLTRAGRVLLGTFRILAAPLRGRHRYVMSVDGGFGLAYNVLMALAARLTGQPVLLFHHSSRYVMADSMAMRVLVAVAGPRAPHVFCSEHMAALFRARYGWAGPALIVSNAAWVDPAQAGMGSPGGLCLGFLSTLTLQKGLGRALATLAAARKSGLAAELALAGPLVDQEARDLVARAQTEFGSALSVRGVVTGADKVAFYGALDIFLFPSLYPHETQSLVVPEALAAGTPVIAFDHRFVGEIMGPAGKLIPETEDYTGPAVDFVAAGRDEAVRRSRRAVARAQFDRERARAEGQIERLIGWACGGEAG